eukprot:CAMPEP_0197072684 /NCGR_PEP_ID=MMETSP1384-20130603/210224_1 /TAXON_ID=29189 /ORGANISM="Ammonia sp." /LENGTH=174 /DNA_ID=CAMNT_0042511505 /DNA_START=34 /DNA_END=558 /DNA_ORIENTATION=+
MAYVDNLKLASDASIKRMLHKFGDNYPKPEQVVLSTALIKINKKEKEQKRILLLTNKALYNLKPGHLKAPQRRIDYRHIEAISVCDIADEFTVHVFKEYDYRFKSLNKGDIANVLSGLCWKVQGKMVPVQMLMVFDLSDITCTREQAKTLSVQQRKHKIEATEAVKGKQAQQAT